MSTVRAIGTATASSHICWWHCLWGSIIYISWWKKVMESGIDFRNWILIRQTIWGASFEWETVHKAHPQNVWDLWQPALSALIRCLQNLDFINSLSMRTSFMNGILWDIRGYAVKHKREQPVGHTTFQWQEYCLVVLWRAKKVSAISTIVGLQWWK